MDIEGKVTLVAKKPTEEIVTLEDLRNLFETNDHPNHYIGLEISGLLHLGSLVVSGFKIRDFIQAGVRCKVFLADWHSFINNKFGGDWEKIRTAAKYYEEAFKFFCPGVEILHGSELYANNDEYWSNIVRFCKQITLARNARCLTIMGRSEREKLDFAQYLYAPMQAVDIRAMDLDFVHAGMDQRKVHMLVREVFPKLGWKKPVAVHHHLLPGLAEPTHLGIDDDEKMDVLISSKMSKSKPWTAIFIHDSAQMIDEKIRKAWCPERLVENNPILELVEHLIFHENRSFSVERAQKFGGTINFEDYVSVAKAFEQRKLHPADLKRAVSKAIDKIVDPIRSYFESNKELLKVFEEEA